MNDLSTWVSRRQKGTLRDQVNQVVGSIWFNMIQCLSFIPPHMAKPCKTHGFGPKPKPKLSLLKITDNSDENLVSPFRDYGNLNLQGGAQV